MASNTVAFRPSDDVAEKIERLTDDLGLNKREVMDEAVRLLWRNTHPPMVLGWLKLDRWGEWLKLDRWGEADERDEPGDALAVCHSCGQDLTRSNAYVAVMSDGKIDPHICCGGCAES